MKFGRAGAVCNNKQNERMKGLRIYPAKVWTTKPRMDALEQKYAEEHALPDCKTWDDPVFCREGKIAFGTVVHYTLDGMTGLALRCKKIQW